MHAGWDQHNSVTTELYTQCKDTDQPSAALVRDLKQRGLLDDTLVLWGGIRCAPHSCREISTSATFKWGPRPPPVCVYGMDGRRWHQPRHFLWGFRRTGHERGGRSPSHIHDLRATILRQLGIDHERLTYKFQGRYYRLTDVHGQVVRDITFLRPCRQGPQPQTSHFSLFCVS